MPPTLALPDIRSTLDGFRRRIEVLERRIRPQGTTSSGFGANPDWYMGAMVWFQQQIDVPDATLVRVEWDAGDVLLSDTQPSGTPFWTIDPAGYPITYAPGVYYVTGAIGLNDIPSTAAGKQISFDINGFENHHVVSVEEAAAGSGTPNLSQTVVVPASGGFDFGGGELRIQHALGEQLDDVYANLIVLKIGHVD